MTSPALREAYSFVHDALVKAVEEHASRFEKRADLFEEVRRIGAAMRAAGSPESLPHDCSAPGCQHTAALAPERTETG